MYCFEIRMKTPDEMSVGWKLRMKNPLDENSGWKVRRMKTPGIVNCSTIFNAQLQYYGIIIMLINAIKSLQNVSGDVRSSAHSFYLALKRQWRLHHHHPLGIHLSHASVELSKMTSSFFENLSVAFLIVLSVKFFCAP